MHESENSDLAALNSLLSAIGDLQMYLRFVSDHLRGLTRYKRDLDLTFDVSGEFRGASYRHNPERTYLAHDPYCIEIKSHCEWLPKYVDGLHKAKEEVEKALFALPTHLAGELNALTGLPWAAAVRRHCLDEILAWPGEVLGRGMWGSTVLGDVWDLLEKSAKWDPQPKWAEYIELLRGYSRDAYAIRGSVLPKSEGVSVIAPASISSDPIAADPDIVDVVTLLTQAGHRLTLPDMLSKFDSVDNLKAESTVKPKLARAVSAGVLTNRQDTRPKGYGLPGWA